MTTEEYRAQHDYARMVALIGQQQNTTDKREI